MLFLSDYFAGRDSRSSPEAYLQQRFLQFYSGHELNDQVARGDKIDRERSLAVFIDLENLAVGRRISYDVQANWKLIIENFMECYHCATIHPELTEVLPEFADGYAAQCFYQKHVGVGVPAGW